MRFYFYFFSKKISNKKRLNGIICVFSHLKFTVSDIWHCLLGELIDFLVESGVWGLPPSRLRIFWNFEEKWCKLSAKNHWNEKKRKKKNYNAADILTRAVMRNKFLFEWPYLVLVKQHVKCVRHFYQQSFTKKTISDVDPSIAHGKIWVANKVFENLECH